MTGQAWLQTAGFFAIAVPVIMVLTHLASNVAQWLSEDPLKTRTYTDFEEVREDLMAGVSIEEILRRCDGHIPQERKVETPAAVNPSTSSAYARLDELTAVNPSTSSAYARLDELRNKMFKQQAEAYQQSQEMVWKPKN